MVANVTLAASAQIIRRALECSEAAAGKRLDQFVAAQWSEFSRSQLAQWIAQGALTVDGKVVRPRHKLLGGEQLQLEVTPRQHQDWASGQPVPFHIVYEDAHVWVIDKPAGVVVHPGAGQPDHTLVNGLIYRDSAQSHLPRAGIVHRLDQHTTGLMVVARTGEAHAALVRAIAQRQVNRRYLAVCEGHPASQTISAAIGRDRKMRTRMAVVADGKSAVTHVAVVQKFALHSLLQVRLETGRTHQIRVHLSAQGHPLVGDRLYGARGIVPPHLVDADASAQREVLHGFSRQALHAQVLEFAHPVTGEWVSVEAPVPEDMLGLLEVLGHDQL